jgi:hypothetical protein
MIKLCIIKIFKGVKDGYYKSSKKMMDESVKYKNSIKVSSPGQ